MYMCKAQGKCIWKGAQKGRKDLTELHRTVDAPQKHIFTSKYNIISTECDLAPFMYVSFIKTLDEINIIPLTK